MSKLARERRLDFRQIVLHVQADNSSKECKNNCLLRHCAWQVALRRLKAAQISFLMSGHSHEDIDSLFSHLRSWLAQFAELPTPESFRDCLEQYFSDHKHRPEEALRDVIRMDRFRDWILVLFKTQM